MEYVSEFKLHLQNLLTDEFINAEDESRRRKWRIFYAVDKSDLQVQLRKILES